jgi:hypothetical protein
MDILCRSPEVGQSSTLVIRRSIKYLKISNSCVIWVFAKTMHRTVKSEIYIHIVLTWLEQKSISIVTKLTIERGDLSALSGVDRVKNGLSYTFISWLKDFDSISIPIWGIWFKC